MSREERDKYWIAVPPTQTFPGAFSPARLRKPRKINSKENTVVTDHSTIISKSCTSSSSLGSDSVRAVGGSSGSQNSEAGDGPPDRKQERGRTKNGPARRRNIVYPWGGYVGRAKESEEERMRRAKSSGSAWSTVLTGSTVTASEM